MRIRAFFGRSYKRVDEKYGFYTLFDPDTGSYHRSNVYKDGKDTGKDPFMASFPHLIDVGIMGHCTHANTGRCSAGCYQGGAANAQPNMTVEDFKTIAEQSAGKVDQFALGGRGDPDQHENIIEILDICHENGIVPNFTTSGYGLTDDIANHLYKCGAVAVSWYRQDYTNKAIELLLEYNVKTNIHYVLSNKTIDEAITRLERSDFPKSINAVIFLLHKPVGLGSKDAVLGMDDPRLPRFFELMDKGGQHIKIGIDSCTSPGVINYCKDVLLESIDTCEGGRFSCYIGADMVMVPCSFDQDRTFAVSLREQTIEQAWNSDIFDLFRNYLHESCHSCKDRVACMGGCPIVPQITLCNRPEKRRYHG